jgi:hypothetical protein
MQLFSYPHEDYLAGHPSVERLAETLDKLEEDVLKVQTAGVRGPRKAVITFGEPVLVTPDQRPRRDALAVSRELQFRVQDLLNQVNYAIAPLPSPETGDQPFELPLPDYEPEMAMA